MTSERDRLDALIADALSRHADDLPLPPMSGEHLAHDVITRSRVVRQRRRMTVAGAGLGAAAIIAGVAIGLPHNATQQPRPAAANSSLAPLPTVTAPPSPSSVVVKPLPTTVAAPSTAVAPLPVPVPSVATSAPTATQQTTAVPTTPAATRTATASPSASYDTSTAWGRAMNLQAGPPISAMPRVSVVGSSVVFRSKFGQVTLPSWVKQVVKILSTSGGYAILATDGSGGDAGGTSGVLWASASGLRTIATGQIGGVAVDALGSTLAYSSWTGNAMSLVTVPLSGGPATTVTVANPVGDVVSVDGAGVILQSTQAVMPVQQVAADGTATTVPDVTQVWDGGNSFAFRLVRSGSCLDLYKWDGNVAVAGARTQVYCGSNPSVTVSTDGAFAVIQDGSAYKLLNMGTHQLSPLSLPAALPGAPAFSEFGWEPGGIALLPYRDSAGHTAWVRWNLLTGNVERAPLPGNASASITW